MHPKEPATGPGQQDTWLDTSSAGPIGSMRAVGSPACLACIEITPLVEEGKLKEVLIIE